MMTGGRGGVDGTYDVLVVGAGHAGAQIAVALRQRGFTGSIALVGDEPEPPYERPPLSKDYLAGEKPFERILIRPPAFWAERDIALLAGHAVVAIDPVAHVATLADGRMLGYATMVWAAGGAARRLTCSGHDVRGVHAVRSRADVDRMIVELATVERVGVIGGGYIGLEAAAVLTKLGKRVTVLEAQERVLARVAGEPLSRFFEAEHRARGVDVRLGTQVACIEADAGWATGIRLADGQIVASDMVVVGIGIVPAVAPLAAAGARCGNGVLVDARCRTSLDDVYAIGDGAARAHAFAGGATVRIESVQNAGEQAAIVAHAIAGGAEPAPAVPWFWSNQYDLKLQTVGLSAGYDALVVRGVPETRSFSVVYLRDGAVIALDCVNATRDYVQGKALVTGRARVARELLADPSRPLKDLAASP